MFLTPSLESEIFGFIGCDFRRMIIDKARIAFRPSRINAELVKLNFVQQRRAHDRLCLAEIPLSLVERRMGAAEFRGAWFGHDVTPLLVRSHYSAAS